MRGAGCVLGGGRWSVGAERSSNGLSLRSSPIAKRVIRRRAPGALTTDFAHSEYQKRRLDYASRVDTPLALAEDL